MSAFNIFTVHIGDRLGFYRELSSSSSLTSAELAARSGILPLPTGETRPYPGGRAFG